MCVQGFIMGPKAGNWRIGLWLQSMFYSSNAILRFAAALSEDICDHVCSYSILFQLPLDDVPMVTPRISVAHDADLSNSFSSLEMGQEKIENAQQVPLFDYTIKLQFKLHYTTIGFLNL